MKQEINRIAAAWGALATGPAIWGVSAMLEKGEVLDLDPPSPYYAIAVVASALMGTAAMLTSCCIREDTRNMHDDRLERLESGLAEARREIEDLRSREMPVTEGEPSSNAASPDFWV